jgi:hypothetical protein
MVGYYVYREDGSVDIRIGLLGTQLPDEYPGLNTTSFAIPIDEVRGLDLALFTVAVGVDAHPSQGSKHEYFIEDQANNRYGIEVVAGEAKLTVWLDQASGKMYYEDGSGARQDVDLQFVHDGTGNKLAFVIGEGEAYYIAYADGTAHYDAFYVNSTEYAMNENANPHAWGAAARDDGVSGYYEAGQFVVGFEDVPLAYNPDGMGAGFWADYTDILLALELPRWSTPYIAYEYTTENPPPAPQEDGEWSQWALVAAGAEAYVLVGYYIMNPDGVMEDMRFALAGAGENQFGDFGKISLEAGYSIEYFLSNTPIGSGIIYDGGKAVGWELEGREITLDADGYLQSSEAFEFYLNDDHTLSIIVDGKEYGYNVAYDSSDHAYTGHVIYGSDGDDVISATSGNDILYGGGGEDTFAWTLDVMGGGTDIIKDFKYDFAENSGDVLQFNDLLGGDQGSLSALLKLGTLNGNVFTADDGANSITLTLDAAKATLNVQIADQDGGRYSQTVVLEGCDYTQQVTSDDTAYRLLHDIIKVGGNT